MWIDPGFGFGKSLAHSLTLLARLDELVAAGFPVAVATSRKRFVGALLAASDARAAEPALPGCSHFIAASTPSTSRLMTAAGRPHRGIARHRDVRVGARRRRSFRVHDVRATANAVRLLTAEVAA